jgi:hypothetical protein
MFRALNMTRLRLALQKSSVNWSRQMTRAEIEELAKRIEAEELRMQRLWQVASDYRDKHHGTDSAFDWNAMRHAISGRDPVLPEAATLARQLLAVMEERDKALAIADEVADEFMARGQVEEAFGANEVAERLRAALQGDTP